MSEIITTKDAADRVFDLLCEALSPAAEDEERHARDIADVVERHDGILQTIFVYIGRQKFALTVTEVSL